jgi:hypothetical protein
MMRRVFVSASSAAVAARFVTDVAKGSAEKAPSPNRDKERSKGPAEALKDESVRDGPGKGEGVKQTPKSGGNEKHDVQGHGRGIY